MPGGQQFTTQVDDGQGQLVLSPGNDRLALEPAMGSVVMAAPAGAGTVDTLRNHQVPLERLVQANAEEMEGASLPGPDANDAQASPLPATQLFAPVFSIGTTPLLNAFLYRNSPGQLAVEQLFLALAHQTDTPDDDLNKPIWDWAPNCQDAAKQDDFAPGTKEQQVGGQQSLPDHSAAADKVFAQLADDVDAFSA
jgi:hypothetical protein